MEKRAPGLIVRRQPRYGEAMKSDLLALLLRVSLASSLLASVLKRFGFWNAGISLLAPSSSHVGTMFPFVPADFRGAVAWTLVLLSLVLALALLAGVRMRVFGAIAGGWLLVAGLAILVQLGLVSAIESSIFVASAAGFALSQLGAGRFALAR